MQKKATVVIFIIANSNVSTYRFKKKTYFVETRKFGCVYFTPKSSQHSAQYGFCSAYDRPRRRGAVDVPLHLFRSLAERPPHHVAVAPPVIWRERDRVGMNKKGYFCGFSSFPPSLSLSLYISLGLWRNC